MKISVKDRIRGYGIITLSREESDAYLNKFLEYKVIFKTFKRDNEAVRIIVPYSEISYIKKLFSGQKEFDIEIKGFVKYFLRYKKRIGIPLGAVLAFLICFYFSLLVWDIKIEGNVNISDEYVKNLLEENGLRVGVYRDSIDVDKLCNEILINDGNFGWLSVNFRGTTAFVEVMEYAGKENEKQSTPCNLVAKRDGYILSVTVNEGSPAVKAGESVKKGDLLISGIVDSNTHGYILKSADGSVLAEVYEEYRLEVPYKYTEKVYSGRTFREKHLIFLGNSIKVYENSGNNGENCDIIETVRTLELFDRIKLPVELRERVYNEYEMREVTLTREDAANIAYAKLEETLESITEDGEIIRKSVNGYAEDTAYIIDLAVYKATEICETQMLSTVK